MDTYRWARGRVLTLAGVGVLVVALIALVANGAYQLSGVEPCGHTSAIVLSSGSHNHQTRTGSEQRWQHRFETPSGDVHLLGAPDHRLDVGSDVQITLRCNRQGEPMLYAWFQSG